MRLNHKHMLAHFSETLLDDVVDRMGQDVEPHASLVIAIMMSSIKDRDKKYIYNGGLQAACKMLQLRYKPVKHMFKDMHRIIKNNIEWSRPC